MKTKRFAKLLALAMVALMCASALTACAFGKAAKYREALELTAQGDYEAAYALFIELGDYKDADREASRFGYMPLRFDDYSTVGEDAFTAEYTFSYNENNLPSQRFYSYSDGYEHTCDYFYNENGNLIKISCSDINGLTGETEITYNEKGQQTTIKATYSDGYYYIYEYFYDEKGNLYKTEIEDDGEFITYESFFDAEDRMTKQIEIDKDGNQLSTEEHSYDEKGNLIKITYTEMGTVTGFDEYTYDENGLRISEHHESASGYICDTYYTYDANYNLIKEHIVDNENYEYTCNSSFKLVYIPFDYAEEEWYDLCEVFYYW